MYALTLEITTGACFACPTLTLQAMSGIIMDCIVNEVFSFLLEVHFSLVLMNMFTICFIDLLGCLFDTLVVCWLLTSA